MTTPASLAATPSHVPVRMVPGDEVPAMALHQAFREAFADYLIGPFEVELDEWPAFLARQGADLARSRVALAPDGQALAFALVATRPLQRRWRLATMGARPQARGTGAAAALLDDFIARAAQADQQAVELEVFAQNERARRLYEGRGFRPIHALRGWQGPLNDLSRPPSTQASDAPLAVDLPTALHWLDEAERRWPDLPLQVTRAVLHHLPEPLAWQCGTGQLVFSLPDETVMVNSFVAPDPRDARTLIQALARVYPQRRLRVPQLQRDDLGGEALRALGAVPMPLHQCWMQRDL